MIKQLNTLLFVAILILLSSCEDKEAEKLKRKEEKEKYIKEIKISLNKDFIYQCTIISYKTKIPIDTVKKVLKEYFTNKKGMRFYNNSFTINDYANWDEEEIHNLDLIKVISNKYSIPYNDVVAVYSELEGIDRIDELKDEIYSLENKIEDLESVSNNSE